MKKIPLTGKYSHLSALVDDADYELVSQYQWQHYHHKDSRVSYAIRQWREGGVRNGVRMHTLVTGWPLVDHINLDGLDNRRENLRPATQRENTLNQRKRADRRYSSRFKGVGAHQGRWRAYIKVNFQYKHIGTYLVEEEAALAYDAAALLHFGEFAYLNFPEEK